MPLVAGQKVKLRQLAQESRLLILYQAFRVLYQLRLAVQIHDTHHLLLLILDGSALVYHVFHVLETFLIGAGHILQILLQEDRVHHHHVWVEVLRLHLEDLGCNVFPLLQGEAIEFLIGQIPRFRVFLDDLLVVLGVHLLLH